MGKASELKIVPRWDSRTPPYLEERFPLPDTLSAAPAPYAEFEVWQNNANALLTLQFYPSHWRAVSPESPVLVPPLLRFESLLIHDPLKMCPGGYLHFHESRPLIAVESICTQDVFTRQIDEYFIAMLWNGKNRDCIEGIDRLPGIGATLQHRHFTKAPHEILQQEVFYASVH